MKWFYCSFYNNATITKFQNNFPFNSKSWRDNCLKYKQVPCCKYFNSQNVETKEPADQRTTNTKFKNIPTRLFFSKRKFTFCNLSRSNLKYKIEWINLKLKQTCIFACVLYLQMKYIYFCMNFLKSLVHEIRRWERALFLYTYFGGEYWYWWFMMIRSLGD